MEGTSLGNLYFDLGIKDNVTEQVKEIQKALQAALKDAQTIEIGTIKFKSGVLDGVKTDAEAALKGLRAEVSQDSIVTSINKAIQNGAFRGINLRAFISEESITEIKSQLNNIKPDNLEIAFTGKDGAKLHLVPIINDGKPIEVAQGGTVKVTPTIDLEDARKALQAQLSQITGLTVNVTINPNTPSGGTAPRAPKPTTDNGSQLNLQFAEEDAKRAEKVKIKEEDVARTLKEAEKIRDDAFRQLQEELKAKQLDKGEKLFGRTSVINIIEGEVTDGEEFIKKEKQKLEKLCAELADYKTKSNNAKKQLKGIKAEIKSLNEELGKVPNNSPRKREIISDIAELETKTILLKADINSYKKAISPREEGISDIRDMIEIGSSNVEDAKRRLEEAKREYESIKTDFDNEINSIQQRIDETKKNTISVSQQPLTTDASKVKGSSAVTTANDKERESYKLLVAEIDALKQKRNEQLSGIDAEIQKQRDIVSVNKEYAEALRNSVSSHNESRKNAEARIAENQKEIELRNASIAELKEKLKETRSTKDKATYKDMIAKDEEWIKRYQDAIAKDSEFLERNKTDHADAAKKAREYEKAIRDAEAAIQSLQGQRTGVSSTFGLQIDEKVKKAQELKQKLDTLSTASSQPQSATSSASKNVDALKGEGKAADDLTAKLKAAEAELAKLNTEKQQLYTVLSNDNISSADGQKAEQRLAEIAAEEKRYQAIIDGLKKPAVTENTAAKQIAADAAATKEAAQQKVEAAKEVKEAAKIETEAAEQTKAATEKTEKTVRLRRKATQELTAEEKAAKENEAAVKAGITAIKKLDTAMDSMRLSIARKGKKVTDELRAFKEERNRIYNEVAAMEGGKQALLSHRSERLTAGRLTNMKVDFAYNSKVTAVQEKEEEREARQMQRLGAKLIEIKGKTLDKMAQMEEQNAAKVIAIQTDLFMKSEKLQWQQANKSSDMSARGGKNTAYEKNVALLEEFQKRLLEISSIEDAMDAKNAFKQLSSNVQAASSDADKLNNAFVKNNEAIDKLATAARQKFETANASGKTALSKPIYDAYSELQQFYTKLQDPKNRTSIEELGREYEKIKLQIIGAESALKATNQQSKELASLVGKVDSLRNTANTKLASLISMKRTAPAGADTSTLDLAIQKVKDFKHRLNEASTTEKLTQMKNEFASLSNIININVANMKNLRAESQSVADAQVGLMNQLNNAKQTYQNQLTKLPTGYDGTALQDAIAQLEAFKQKVSQMANTADVARVKQEFVDLKLQLSDNVAKAEAVNKKNKEANYTQEESLRKIEAALVRVGNAQRKLDNYNGNKQGQYWQAAQKSLNGYAAQLHALKGQNVTSKATIDQVTAEYGKAALAMNRFLDEQRRVDAALNATSRSSNNASKAVNKHADAWVRLSGGLNKSKGLLGLNINLTQQLGSMIGMYFSIYTLKSFIGGIAQIYGEFEKTKIALGSILNDTARANELFNQLKSLAVQSPYQFKDLTSFAKQLSAFSFPVDELYDTTKRLADISAGLGVDMGRVILAVGQVRSAAYLRGQELRQFTEAGIPMLDELAKKFTVLKGRVIDTGQVFDMISKRQVPYEMVKEVIDDLTNEGGKFYKMQEVLAESLAGKISNLTDAYNIMEYEIGKMGAGDFLGGSVDTLKALMQHWKTLGNIIVSVGVGYAASAVRNLIYHKKTVTAIGEEIAAYRAKAVELNKERALIVQLGATTQKYGASEEFQTKAKLHSMIASKNLTEMDLIRLRVQGTLTDKTLQYGLAQMKVDKTQAASISQMSRYRLYMVAAGAATVRQAASMSKWSLAISLCTVRLKAMTVALWASMKAMFFNPATWVFAAVTAIASVVTAYMTKQSEYKQAMKEAADAAKEAFNDIRESMGDIDLPKIKEGSEKELTDDMKSKILSAVERMKEVIKKHSPLAAQDIFDIDSISDIVEKLKLTQEIVEGLKNTTSLKQDVARVVADYDNNGDYKDMNYYRNLFSKRYADYDMSKLPWTIKALEQSGFIQLSREVQQMSDAGESALNIFTKLGVAYANSRLLGRLALRESMIDVESVVKPYYEMKKAQQDIDKEIRSLAVDAHKVAESHGFKKGSREYNNVIEDAWAQYENKMTEMGNNEFAARYSRVAFEKKVFGYSETQAKDIVDAYLKTVAEEQRAYLDVNSEEFQEEALKKMRKLMGTLGTDMEGFELDSRVFEVMARNLPKPDITGWRKEIVDAIDGIKQTSDVYIKIKESKSVEDVIDDLQKIYKSATETIDKQKPLLLKIGIDPNSLDDYFDKDGNIIWDKITMDGVHNEDYYRETLTTARQARTQQNEAKAGLTFTGASLTANTSHSSTADKQLQAWKKQFDTLKKIYSDYKSWSKDLGRDKAISFLQESGIKSEDVGDISLFDPKKMQEYFEKMRTRILKNPMTSEERKAFENTLNEYKIQLQVDVDKESLDNALGKVKNDLEEYARKYNIYKKVFSLTGDKGLAGSISFNNQLFGGEDNYVQDIKDAFDIVARQFGYSYADLERRVKDEDFMKGVPDAIKSRFEEARKYVIEFEKDLDEVFNKVIEDHRTTSQQIAANTAEMEQKLTSIRKQLKEGTITNAMAGQLINAVKSNYGYKNFQLSSDYIKFYSAIYSMSVSRAKEVGEAIKENLDEKLKAGTISAKEYVKEMENIRKQVQALTQKKSNFLTYVTEGLDKLIEQRRELAESKYNAASQNYSDATDKISQLQDLIERANKTGDSASRERYQNELETAKAAQNAASSEMEAAQSSMDAADGMASTVNTIDMIVKSINDAIQGIYSAAQKIAEYQESNGVDTSRGGWGETLAVLGAFSDASKEASSAFDSMKSGNIGGAISGLVGTFTSFGTALNKWHDEKLQQKIEDSQKYIDNLIKSTEYLGKILDRSFGAGESAITRLISSYNLLAKQVKNAGSSISDSYMSALTLSSSTGYQDMIQKYEDDINKFTERTKKKTVVGAAVGAVKGVVGSVYGAVIGSLFGGKKVDNTWKIEIDKEAIEALKAIGSGEIKNKLGEAYRAEYAALVAQRAEVETQLRNEEQSKKVDKDAVADYQEKIAELNDQITYFVQDLAEELYSIDFEDWSGQISDALVNAFRNGENAAEAFKETTNDILSTIANKMLQLNIIEPMFEELETLLFGTTDANGNRTGGVATMENLFDAPEKVAKAISDWFNTKGNDMLSEVDAFLEIFNDATGGALTDNTTNKSGLSAGITGITEETADLLASYVNAIRADLSYMRTRATDFYDRTMPDVTATLGAQLASLKLIEANTLRTANGIDSLVETSEDTYNLLKKATTSGSGVKLNI